MRVTYDEKIKNFCFLSKKEFVNQVVITKSILIVVTIELTLIYN